MPSHKKTADSKPLPLKLEVCFEGQPGEEISVEAYAFDGQGRYLASATVSRDEATLALTEEQRREARLFFAPPLIEGRIQETPSLELMERLGAYEAAWSYDSEVARQAIPAFPEVHWRYWLWCSCRVRGRVVRPVEAGGSTYELPICHARVHICEVDRIPWVIRRLPDREILRLRDDLIAELERPFPRPLPDPPPFEFDPGVIDPSPENLAGMLRAQRGVEEANLDLSDSVLAETAGGDLDGQSFVEARPAEPFLARAEVRETLASSASFSALPVESRAPLLSNSATVVRGVLAERTDLLLPFLCYWPWFLKRLRCDEIAVVHTDHRGRFDTTVHYLCFGDHPDLYFWADVCIGSSWITVYRPPLACNTHWNYACGSEVTLRVTDPRAPICKGPEELPGLQVAVLSIGNGVSVSEIGSDGLTSGRPFGGILEPRVAFSHSALIAAGITHYRWSYRRRTRSDGSPVSDSWHPLHRKVVRHYGLIEGSGTSASFSFPAFPLGPDPDFPGENLFKIQRSRPQDHPELQPNASSITGWTPIDGHEDLASAFFETHLLSSGDAAAAAGKYELLLELFDSTGARVDLTARGVSLKEASQPAPFGTGALATVPAQAHHLQLDSNGHVVGFKLRLHIDNNPCEAHIHPITGTGVTVDSNCGFIEYGPGATVTLKYKAWHPNGFATFDFEIHRGASIKVPEASADGGVGPTTGSGNHNVDGFVRERTQKDFEKTVPVGTLLTSNKPHGTPDCKRAAFAETLHVNALATNGWGDLDHLDARGIPAAFALDEA